MDPVAFARRISNLPATLQTTTRQRIARSLEQLRLALDLPSRKELAELTTRLEALDERIASLAAQRVSELGRVVPTLTDGSGPVAVPEPVLETAAEAEAPVVAEAAAEAPVVAEAAVEAAVEAAAEAGNGARPQHHNSKKKPLKNRR